ncbi:MAG TPA: ATP synthase F1 subunit gamma [Acidimicrobiales bacterium]|nr:ATP synthase F1 subunit gamma [Acidimicrobiales bacterium]
MAGGQERILRRRIKSVQNTRKITKAMELIAASQIARSQARIVANRPYRSGMRRIIIEAAMGDPAGAKKLLAAPEHVRNVLVLVITGDRGLSGAYNSSVMRAGERLVNEFRSKGVGVRLFAVGKKASAFYRFRGIEVEDSFIGFADRPTFTDARAVGARMAAPFIDGEVEQVLLVSTRFLSAATQSVEVEQLLPLTLPELPEAATTTKLKGYTEFEPEVEQLLTELAPRALESEVFAALLEGAASFHTSQQRAMAAATDNADDLGLSLTRIMNRARQDSITTEIMEIVGGAEALRSGK